MRTPDSRTLQLRSRAAAVAAVGIIASTLLACGGSRQNAATFDLAPFQALARGAVCARTRNSLFLIDDQFVFWARQDDSCADNNYAYTLYGRTPDTVLCRSNATVGGPRSGCADSSVATLFDTATQHLNAPDLGLAPAHRVRTVPLGDAQ